MSTRRPLLAEHVLEGHLDVLEDQLSRVRPAHPELVEMRRGGEALHLLLDEEGGDPLGSRLGVGLGVDDERVGVGPVRDPVLRAVQDVAVVPLLGAELHPHHVRTRARLRHGERAHVLARDEAGRYFALLLFRAVQLDLVDAEVGVGAVGQADRGRGAADLLDRDGVREVAHARAAVFLVHGDAQKPKLPHLAPELVGKRVGPVDLGRHRLHAVLRPAVDHLAQRVHVLAEVERHRGHEHGTRPPLIERLFI
jgi:hypothetical protein